MPLIDEMVELVTRVTDLAAPNAQAIGVTLRCNVRMTDDDEYMMEYALSFESGRFSEGEFRVAKMKPGSALLSLVPQPNTPIVEAELSFDEFGPLVAMSPNPRIPPEGTSAYIYRVNDVNVSFQFHRTSRTLRTLAFDWDPDDPHER